MELCMFFILKVPSGMEVVSFKAEKYQDLPFSFQTYIIATNFKAPYPLLYIGEAPTCNIVIVQEDPHRYPVVHKIWASPYGLWSKKGEWVNGWSGYPEP